jgi:hypothetical protein
MEVRTNADKIEDSPGGAEIGANRMSPVWRLVIVGSLPPMWSTQAEFEFGIQSDKARRTSKNGGGRSLIVGRFCERSSGLSSSQFT